MVNITHSTSGVFAYFKTSTRTIFYINKQKVKIKFERKQKKKTKKQTKTKKQKQKNIRRKRKKTLLYNHNTRRTEYWGADVSMYSISIYSNLTFKFCFKFFHASDQRNELDFVLNSRLRPLARKPKKVTRVLRAKCSPKCRFILLIKIWIAFRTSTSCSYWISYVSCLLLGHIFIYTHRCWLVTILYIIHF